jgi:DNA-binding response OmpR family regulator
MAVAPRKAPRRAILIAGLSRDAREMYQEYFTWAGWRVALAAESGAAFDLAVAEQPDVVATSDRLRPRNGLELCEQLHADSRTEQLPVIILTTATSVVDRQRARAAGCAMLLIQPILPRRLLTESRRLVARALRAKHRAEAKDALRTSAPAKKPA